MGPQGKKRSPEGGTAQGQSPSEVVVVTTPSLEIFLTQLDKDPSCGAGPALSRRRTKPSSDPF